MTIVKQLLINNQIMINKSESKNYPGSSLFFLAEKTGFRNAHLIILNKIVTTVNKKKIKNQKITKTEIFFEKLHIKTVVNSLLIKV